ncbi:unnamed protein product [Protopolystoma xenopodis]|uniref:Small EDRK-rich factor-like N-terminal domain-containing protein n=1 Tax=Protopolystoma xenopodis TaxID=117903 RepID=A0A3S5CT91_9PLAT|nr:unnamed protein product [Protopolystoma xenopodis]
MARGHQKALAQQRKLKKQTETKKTSDNKKSAAAGLTHSCVVCMSQMPDPKTYRQHFENKHPKTPLPDVLKECL